jgi:hypothetical protein
MTPGHSDTTDALPNQSADPSRRRTRRIDDPEVVTNRVPKFVTRAGASFLLGIAEGDLSLIAKQLGLGRSVRAGDQEETYFTYEELQRIRMNAMNPAAVGSRIEDFLAEVGSGDPRGDLTRKRTDGCALPERFGEIQFSDMENKR